MDGFMVVLTTLPDEKSAEELIRHLLEEKLAACATMIRARSLYWWEEKISDDQEILVLIKTRTGIYQAIEDRIKQLHPYQVPEIIALPAVAGNKAYFDWIKEVTRT